MDAATRTASHADTIRPLSRRRRPAACPLLRLVRAVPALDLADEPERHGTLRDVIDRLPYVAELGFDVLYLPPIHPIGAHLPQGPQQRRRAPRRTTRAARGRSAAPRAATRRSTRSSARSTTSIAWSRPRRSAASSSRSTSPSSARPTTRGSTRAPGLVPPPARRHDPVRREPAQEVPGHLPVRLRDARTGARCGTSCCDVVRFWIDQGVAIFRVDNPHTKPFPFWEWLIGEVKRDHPDVIFLAEAFTRPEGDVPPGQGRLHASRYTYFTWRNDEARAHRVLHRAHAARRSATIFRPNFWPNTPDILHEYLQHGGRPAFAVRLVLAATLARQLRHLRTGVRARRATSRASRAARSTSTRRSTRSGTGT